MALTGLKYNYLATWLAWLATVHHRWLGLSLHVYNVL